MATSDVVDVAAALRYSIGLLRRRLRQLKAESADGGITLPESAALVRLDRGGPATSSELARQEHISPQSMGATLTGLQARGLVGRQPDPLDGRRVLLSISEAGRQILRDRRGEHTQLLARALAAGFTPDEVDVLRTAAPLLQRLAEHI